ncbi:hypothetical protein GGF46_000439 [Coemansia sp. RSA 552]|nr:hypothetical protein GGF46_000439 [Coemansia sp. RSA 552]
MATKDSGAAWTPEVELALYMSMVGLRPVGIHRHFRMINIYTRLQQRLGRSDIPLGEVKEYIDTLFNMPLLDEIEDDYEDDEGSEEGPSEGTGPEHRTDTSTALAEGSRTNSEQQRAGSMDSSGAVDVLEDASKVVPPTSMGVALDTTDPTFWRKKNAEFSLPWADFGVLMVEKAGMGVTEEKDGLEAENTSGASSPKVESPAEAAVPGPDPHDRESSDGRVSPVPRKRRGRSSTPVPRSRTKYPRSAAPRKRQK